MEIHRDVKISKRIPLIGFLYIGVKYTMDHSQHPSTVNRVPPIIYNSADHRCDLGVKSLPLTQRSRARSPLGSVSWLRFFPGFFLNFKTNVRKFGSYSSPGIVWPSSSETIFIRLRTATVSAYELNYVTFTNSRVQPFRHFTYVTTYSPTLPSLYLRHSSFSNFSVDSPMAQFILQPFFRFSCVTSSSLSSPGEPPMIPGAPTWR